MNKRMKPGKTLASGANPPVALPTVYIPARRNGRRFTVVSKVLSAAGIHHRAVFPALRRFKLGRLERSAIESRFCIAGWRLPSSPSLLITDQPKAAANADKVIEISYDLPGAAGRRLTPDEVFHPILFHPDQINDQAYVRAAALSQHKKRPLTMLFAGNCDPATYDTPQMDSEFGLLNRHELHRLVQALPEDKTVFPKTAQELADLINGAEKNKKPLKKLVWVDTRDFRIPAAQWFDLISKAGFFLCTPGARYPWCQNLNEAMACGTVPVLQYPHLYNPALQQGGCALSFAGKSDFGTVMQEALTMRESRIKQLSANALQYHEGHLSLGRIVSVIRAFIEDPERKKLVWYLAGRP